MQLVEGRGGARGSVGRRLAAAFAPQIGRRQLGQPPKKGQTKVELEFERVGIQQVAAIALPFALQTQVRVQQTIEATRPAQFRQVVVAVQHEQQHKVGAHPNHVSNAGRLSFLVAGHQQLIETPRRFPQIHRQVPLAAVRQQDKHIVRTGDGNHQGLQDQIGIASQYGNRFAAPRLLVVDPFEQFDFAFPRHGATRNEYFDLILRQGVVAGRQALPGPVQNGLFRPRHEFRRRRDAEGPRLGRRPPLLARPLLDLFLVFTGCQQLIDFGYLEIGFGDNLKAPFALRGEFGRARRSVHGQDERLLRGGQFQNGVELLHEQRQSVSVTATAAQRNVQQLIHAVR